MTVHLPSQFWLIGALLLAAAGALLGGPIGDACRGVLRGAGLAVLLLAGVAGGMWVGLNGGGAIGGSAVLVGAIGVALIAGATGWRPGRALKAGK